MIQSKSRMLTAALALMAGLGAWAQSHGNGCLPSQEKLNNPSARNKLSQKGKRKRALQKRSHGF